MTIRYENRGNGMSPSAITTGAYSYTWEHPISYRYMREYFAESMKEKVDEYISWMEQNARSLEDYLDYAFIKGNGGKINGDLEVTGNFTIHGYPYVQFPTGGVIPYAGDTPPSGWLLCDGSDYDSSVYPELHIIIGDTYNEQCGATAPASGYFRVPNLLNKTVMGADPDLAVCGDLATGDIGMPGYLTLNYIIKT